MPGYPNENYVVRNAICNDVKRVHKIVCSNAEEVDDCYEKLLYFVSKEDIAGFKDEKYPNIDVRCTREVWDNIKFHLGLDVDLVVAFY